MTPQLQALWAALLTQLPSTDELCYLIEYVPALLEPAQAALQQRQHVDELIDTIRRTVR